MRESAKVTELNISLEHLFQELNEKFFDGFLECPELLWNSRLRTSAGRFVPGGISLRRVSWFRVSTQRLARIEVASYLRGVEDGERHVRSTLAHEMIHYWLWVLRKPYGHTPEFHKKLKETGADRYNPVPQVSPPKYVYGCSNCGKNFPSRRRLGTLACASCCKKHSRGKYDSRFQLILL